MTYFAAPGLKGLKVKTKVDYNKIVILSADFFNLAPEQILSKSRRMDIVDARRHIIHYLRIERGLTLSKIGSLLNGKDHTTIIHGLKSFSDLCQTEPKKQLILKDYLFYITSQL